MKQDVEDKIKGKDSQISEFEMKPDDNKLGKKFA